MHRKDLKEEKKEARETGDPSGLEKAQDRVVAIINAIQDRKEDGKSTKK